MSSIAELVTPKARSRSEFIEECKSGKLDGVEAAYRTFGSVDITGMFDEELVKALPESFKFLCHNGRPSVLVQCPTPSLSSVSTGLYESVASTL